MSLVTSVLFFGPATIVAGMVACVLLYFATSAGDIASVINSKLSPTNSGVAGCAVPCESRTWNGFPGLASSLHDDVLQQVRRIWYVRDAGWALLRVRLLL